MQNLGCADLEMATACINIENNRLAVLQLIYPSIHKKSRRCRRRQNPSLVPAQPTAAPRFRPRRDYRRSAEGSSGLKPIETHSHKPRNQSLAISVLHLVLFYLWKTKKHFCYNF